MLRRNSRLVGYLLVLGLVIASLWYFKQMSQTPPPPDDSMKDMPALGHVPTEEQIHGPGAPPPAKKKQ